MARGSFVRWVIRALLVVVVLVAVACVIVFVASGRMLSARVEVPVAVAPVVLPEPDDTEALERGRYLVDHAFNCRICHAEDFGGRAEIDNAAMGRLWGPNLTTGEGSVTRDYTPTDWARAIRHGLAPDGRRLILMPSEDYFAFSDEDIGAVVAYIRSMPPVDRPHPGLTVGPVARLLLVAGQISFAFDKIDHAAARTPATPGPTLEWGRVLGTTCIGCHGPGLSGGTIPGGDPSWPPAANLTRHETGLAAWTESDFVRAMREGRRPDGTAIRPPMPWQAYAGLTDDDLQALWLFLQDAAPKPHGGR